MDVFDHVFLVGFVNSNFSRDNCEKLGSRALF